MNIITFTFLMFNAFLFVYQGFFTINQFFFNILNKYRRIYRRIISVGIKQRVAKTLRDFATFTDGLPTDTNRRWFNTDGITDGYYPSVIHRELQQKLQAMPSLPTGFPSVMPSVITLEIIDGYISSVMFPRETFFWLARIRRCFRRWVVFFICDRISDENGIYRRLLYRRTWSVDIIFTDGFHCCYRRN